MRPGRGPVGLPLFQKFAVDKVLILVLSNVVTEGVSEHVLFTQFTKDLLFIMLHFVFYLLIHLIKYFFKFLVSLSLSLQDHSFQLLGSFLKSIEFVLFLLFMCEPELVESLMRLIKHMAGVHA